MITTKCLIRFPTHESLITINDQGTIHVFKYSRRSCDFAIFDSHTEQLEAGDYAIEPVDDVHYYVSFPGEDLE
jgi:hypothetical protein